MDETPGIADARIKIDLVHWFLLHYTPSSFEKGILSKQSSSKTPTQPRYIERSLFTKEVNDQNLWNFEMGSQGSMNVPIWTFVGFQQRDRQDTQKLKNDAFFRLAVISAQCIFVTENYPDTGIILNFGDDDYCQGYRQTKEIFRAITKDDIFQLFISHHDYRTELMMLVIFYILSIYDISKVSQPPNQLN